MLTLESSKGTNAEFDKNSTVKYPTVKKDVLLSDPDD